MKDLILTLFQNLGQKLTVFLLLGTTAVTTGAAFTKVLHKPSEVDAKDSISQDANSRAEGATTTPTPEVIDKVETEIITVTPTPTVKNPSPTVVPSQTTGATPTPTVGSGSQNPNNFNSANIDDEKDEDQHDDSNEREDQEHEDQYRNTSTDQTERQEVNR